MLVERKNGRWCSDWFANRTRKAGITLGLTCLRFQCLSRNKNNVKNERRTQNTKSYGEKSESAGIESRSCDRTTKSGSTLITLSVSGRRALGRTTKSRTRSVSRCLCALFVRTETRFLCPTETRPPPPPSAHNRYDDDDNNNIILSPGTRRNDMRR